MKKSKDNGAKVKVNGGNIKVSLPLTDFVKEHKSLVNILESGVQDKIISEAENQRKELKDIITKVKELKEKTMGSGLKKDDFKPEEKPNMTDEKVMKNIKDGDKLQGNIFRNAPDLRKLQK